MVAKSAILVDFDNVFITLWDLDRDAALGFASEPADWLQVLANTHLLGEPRRWLVTRCYLNPAGYVHAPGEPNQRLYFSRFRPGLVRAGFEVIDCPAVARGGKNAADIRIVVDALDLGRRCVPTIPKSSAKGSAAARLFPDHGCSLAPGPLRLQGSSSAAVAQAEARRR